ncbi:MAG: hypothetical protein OXK78_00005, partial [Caldilineaceae bacterium]|nr:hypothetical protein [Caldilineaceae bacterium]
AANAEKRQLATNVCGTFATSHSIINCHAASPPEFCAHWLDDSAIVPTSLYLGRQPKLRFKKKQGSDVVVYCEPLSNGEYRWNRKEDFLRVASTIWPQDRKPRCIQTDTPDSNGRCTVCRHRMK